MGLRFRRLTPTAIHIVPLQGTEGQNPVASTERHKNLLRRQIAATDDEIDRLVYELYGLTEAEIKIVEGTGSVGGPASA